MLKLSATRSRLSLVGSLLFGFPVAARADTLSGSCSASGETFQCRLHQFLHLLYALAALLGIALVVVLVLTVLSYRRNREHPEEVV